MNPSTINDIRPLVWTVAADMVSYCIYLNGNLYAENLNIDAFLKMYDSLRDAT